MRNQDFDRLSAIAPSGASVIQVARYIAGVLNEVRAALATFRSEALDSHLQEGTCMPFTTAGRLPIASNQRFTCGKAVRSVRCHS